MSIRRVSYVLVAILVLGLVIAAAQRRPRATERQPAPEKTSPEQNKEQARRVFDDLFTQGRYGEVDQIYASNAVIHFGNRTESLSQAVEEGKGWRSAAPDLVMTANNITVNGEVVNVNWTARGTHTGQGHGLRPTGKKILIHGSSQFRFANGRIVEAHNSEYRDELFHQLGVPKTAAYMMEKAQDLQASLHNLFIEPFTASQP